MLDFKKNLLIIIIIIIINSINALKGFCYIARKGCGDY